MSPRKVYNLGVPNLTYDKDSGRYRYRNPVTGKRTWLGSDKDAAIDGATRLNEILKIRRELEQSADHGIVTIEFAITRFLERAAEEYAWEPSTRAGQHFAYELYRKEFGHRLIADVDRIWLDDWIRARCSTFSCRKKHRMRLSRLYAFAVGRKWIDINEAELIPGYQASKKLVANQKKRQRMSVDEFWRIHDIAPLFLQVAMELSLLTLQSRQECCNMKRSDIRDGCLFVIRKKTAGDSSAAFIKIAVTEAHERVFSQALSSGIASPYIVHHRPRIMPARDDKRKPHWSYVHPQRLTVAFKLARDRSGMSGEYKQGSAPTFHEIRSLGARLYEEAGYPKEYIRDLMTHSDEKTTDIYLENPQALTDQLFKPVRAELPLPKRS